MTAEEQKQFECLWEKYGIAANTPAALIEAFKETALKWYMRGRLTDLSFARALVNVMSTMKDHEIQEETGLPDDACEEIANARAEAEKLLVAMKSQ